MKTGRQTGLSLEKLIEELRNSSDGHPTCLLLNELGEICMAADGEHQAAEEAIAEFLNHEDIQLRYVSYSFLSVINRRRGTHAHSLSQFRGNPKNAELVELAAQRISQLQL